MCIFVFLWSVSSFFFVLYAVYDSWILMPPCNCCQEVIIALLHLITFDKIPIISLSFTCFRVNIQWKWNRGRSKVRVLAEISLIFLSQTDTFNASSSLKKHCNKFMYWIHGQKISCTFMREPLQRFIFIWNNYERTIAKISFYMK